MHDHRSANNRVLSIKRDLLIGEAHVGVAERIGHEVAEIANMSLIRERSSVVFIEGVVVRSSCCAALSKIAELVNVDAVFAVGTETFDGTGYLGGRVDVVLTERSYSSDSGVVVGVKNTDGVSFGVWSLVLVERKERSERGCAGQGDYFSEHY